MREWQGIMDGAVRELNSDMTPIASRQLVGVMIFVYVSAKLRRGVRNVDVQACRTGLGGIAGNKGGVSVRLTLGYSSLCFVCAHRAAHTKNVRDRNSDYSTIVMGTAHSAGGTALYPARALDPAPEGAAASHILGHDQARPRPARAPPAAGGGAPSARGSELRGPSRGGGGGA